MERPDLPVISTPETALEETKLDEPEVKPKPTQELQSKTRRATKDEVRTYTATTKTKKSARSVTPAPLPVVPPKPEPEPEIKIEKEEKKIEKVEVTKEVAPKKESGSPNFLTDLKSQQQAAWDKIEKIVEIHEKVTAELAQAHTESREQKRQIDELQATVQDQAELHTTLDAAILANQMHADEIEKTKASLKKATAERDALRKELEPIKKELPQLRQELKKETAARREAEARIAAAQASLSGK